MAGPGQGGTGGIVYTLQFPLLSWPFSVIKWYEMLSRFFRFCHFVIPLSTFNLSRYRPRVKKY